MSFWDESWNCINQEKLKSYINNFDFSEDDIIEILTENKKNKILDAGCGCGIYALKLAKNGFDVDGFDIADSAVTIATKIMKDNGFNGNFIGADIKETGFQSELYDAVVCKDVIDHMKKSDAKLAVKELSRLIKKEGLLIITVDSLDDEYLTEKHIIDDDNNYYFCSGKWNGMFFHPYDEEELNELVLNNRSHYIKNSKDGFMLVLKK